MITIKNQRKTTIMILGKEIPALGSIQVEKEHWEKEFAKRRPLRDAVSGGFVLVSSDVPVKVNSKNKNKEE